MKRIIKIGSICIIVINCLLLMTGCEGKPSSKEFIANGIALYEKEFDDDFTFVREVRGGNGTWGEFGTLDEGKMEVIVSSKKYPNKEINMSFLCDRKTKKYRMGGSDYNFIRYEEQLYKDLENVAQIYSDSCIRISTLGMDNSNLNYTEYTSTISNLLKLTVYVVPGQYNKNEDIKKIINVLNEKNIKMRSVEIIYFNDNEEYTRIKAIQNKREYIELKYSTYDNLSVELDEDYNIEHMEYDGKKV